MALTDYHAQYLAHELTRRRGPGDDDRLAGALVDARVDLNPHQIDAALFAFRSPLAKGALLADEVGLGKTIEAGIVIAQHWAERKRRILVITPANLRTQWQQELIEKFFLPCKIIEKRAYDTAQRDGKRRPFEADEVVICSYEYAAAKEEDLRVCPWDLVVIDEAHRLRNIYKNQSGIAATLKSALNGRKLLLITATPLQNSLLELYGLVSFIDDYSFGDRRSFQEQYTGSTSHEALQTLSARLKPICHRTLRRQVQPYIRYTKRSPLLQPFRPTPDEQELYELVSDYLRRDNLQALPTSQRQLMTLVMRKWLASSTFAIAGVLESLAHRLRQRLAGTTAAEEIEETFAAEFDAFNEMAEEWGRDDRPDTAAEQAALRREIAELDAFAELARSITENAKGSALLVALQRAFQEAERLGAARKAVIFTESRKTQDYLFQLLSASVLGGKIVLFNGTNASPQATAIYERWRAEHAGSDRVTGSRPVDIRAALIDEFRDHGEILIATEAGAEGINLQFCSLVVNYDLPWNPQRIEQRIGRCHRYGQKHDVVVVNFLNQENAADQRVFELLEQKFNLFEGVFGASDEVLGAIESGVDFERRIATIYQTCRTEAEINQAFDALQQELSSQIDAEIARVNRDLLEHVDDEVRERLKLRDEQSRQSLTRFEQLLLDLTRYELRDCATFDGDDAFTLHASPFPNRDIPAGHYALPRNSEHVHAYRPGHPLAVALLDRAKTRTLPPAEIEIDYSNHRGRVTALEGFKGMRGWLALSVLKLSTPAQSEEHLLLAAMVDNGTTIDPELAQRLLSLPATCCGTIDPAAPALAFAGKRLGEMTHDQEIDLLAEAAERSFAWLDEEEAKLQAWAADQKLSARRRLKEIETEIKEAKREIKRAGAVPEQLAAKRRVNQLQVRYDDAEADVRAKDRQVTNKMEELLGEVEDSLKRSSSLHDCFIVRWRMV